MSKHEKGRAKSEARRPADKSRELMQYPLDNEGAAGSEHINQVREGLPFYPVTNLANDLGMSTYKLGEQFLGMSRATVTRRRQSDKLTPNESDKVLRYARLLRAATRLMAGNEDAANRWLGTPLPLLGGESPLEYARTEAGAREVEQLIGRIEQGVYS